MLFYGEVNKTRDFFFFIPPFRGAVQQDEDPRLVESVMKSQELLYDRATSIGFLLIQINLALGKSVSISRRM